ncbi:hypothetical protein PHLCEN_2v6269 [Hermanssonia centrifuga]|uniref:non-specific serine/threonine protein kinase n=1 Tax=Hermanssonia centrifuga TaxID=98765 RepID=A0A2R6NZX3_9APHY|nr:hypothetical protein PHLCEN_2v6269 [Hermanssonia centrifuga]
MSFKTNLNSQDPDLAPNAHVIWSQGFTNPVVAVFDVIRSPTRPHPFVLLQPHIGLQDLLPNVDLVSAAKENRLPNLESAYIGLIEETGSLFAMSPDRYPLIVFSDSNFEDDYMREVGRSIDPPPGSFGFVNDRDFPVDVDSITRAMKRKRLKEMCKNGAKDKRCLTGVRRLESSRLSRLLDGAATVPYPPYHYNNAIPQSSDSNVLPGTGNASMTPPAGLPSPRVDNTPRDKMGKSPQALSAYALATLALLVTIIWFFKKHIHWRASTPVAASDNGDAALKTKLETSTADSPQSETAAIDTAAKASAENDITQPITDPVMSPPASMKKVSFGDDAKVVSVSGQDQDDIGDNGGDAEDSDGDAPATPGKRKGIRRRRGKKKKGAIAVNGADDVAENIKDLAKNLEDEVPKLPDDGGFVHIVSPSAIVVSPPPTPTPAAPSLIVSDTILGFGSHGTVVFKGSLQGRAVAVKRLLQDFVTLALREVNILQESDDHPNVIRYYYQEAQANFLYIALELCPASLADVVERPDQFRDISIAFEPKKALRQITSGLRHLHALKIVHRDIKPQNILISSAKKGVGESAGHRMLISDFGLCKKLEIDQTSFLPTAHGAMAAGTVGWRAPEILRGEVKLDESGGEESQSSRGSIGLPPDGSTTGRPTRLTKSVDIFALGCLFYYVLSNGGHPFGDRYERESNIMKDTKSLDALDRFGEEGSDAADLICKMLSPEAYARPDTSTCLLHPYFWDPGKRLNFLQDASDRFEIMCRDPRDSMLIELETGAFNVVGNDWNARLDKWFIENLGKYRKYDGRSVQDLLRALRNKVLDFLTFFLSIHLPHVWRSMFQKHHYQDLPDNVKRQIGSMPEGFLSYFTRRFPRLFLHVHSVIAASSLRQESMFRTYFELTD